MLLSAKSLEIFDSAQSIMRNFVTSIVILVILLALLRVVFLPRIKGWLGERKVSGALRRLDPARYRIFHDLYLPRPDGRGTTQVDHAVASRFGIFVIETKNYSGWIFGSVKQKNWTQQIYRKKSSFQNPLHQNALHVRALEQFLGLEASDFHSIVYFVGDCTFKTELPPNVLREDLAGYILQHQTPILPPEVEAHCADALGHLQGSTNRKTAPREHCAAIRERRQSTGPTVSRPAPPTTLPSIPGPMESQPTEPNPACPLCGAIMIQRIAKRGSQAGNQFWGCPSYPECRGTRVAC